MAVVVDIGHVSTDDGLVDGELGELVEDGRAGVELPHDGAEGEDVDLLVVALVLEDLGRGELHGADGGHDLVVGLDARHTEVADLHVHAAVHQQVRGLQVAVDHRRRQRVQVRHALRRVHRPLQPQRQLQLHRPPARPRHQQVAHVSPRHQLGHDAHLGRRQRDAHEQHDVGVTQAAVELRLLRNRGVVIPIVPTPALDRLHRHLRAVQSALANRPERAVPYRLAQRDGVPINEPRLGQPKVTPTGLLLRLCGGEPRPTLLRYGGGAG